ncbi:SAM-dependent methyltransferase [Kribbella sp. NPDC051587]|uniref:SAM-dependent methyltransferase n=1 Tax=Kribbella sp. NPDC051587 TaxID=3364119 RepID=UPI0037A79DA1
MPEGNVTRRIGPELDLHRPSDARIYDLMLGGKNNFEIDRQVFAELLKVAPEIPQLATENRRWIATAIGRMTDAKVAQFLDLGSGLPSERNLHDVVLAANPRARTVYVDNDVTAISHGQALLADDRSAFFAAADILDPAMVLEHPAVVDALDFEKPVGLIFGLVLHTLADNDQLEQLLNAYLAPLPSGSFVAITHPMNPNDASRLAGFATSIEAKFREYFPRLRFRTTEEITEALTGLEILDPGITDLAHWWPAGEQTTLSPTGAARLVIGALARKP